MSVAPPVHRDRLDRDHLDTVLRDELAGIIDSRLQILLVDDRPERATLMQRVVEDGEHAGHVVAHAATAEDALAVVAAHRIDVALVELQMAAGAGVAIISALHSADHELAVVACSFRSDPVSRLEAQAAGATAFLAKPISTSDVHSVVARRPAATGQLDPAMRRQPGASS
ncbi:MAG: response regulator [Actinomycetota bacterium]|nr:response regulator [Actinomycetota bacterium]